MSFFNLSFLGRRGTRCFLMRALSEFRFRPQLSYLLSGPPDFHVAEFGELGFEVFPIIILATRFDDDLRFLAQAHTLVQLVVNRLHRLAKLMPPIQSSTLGCCRAIGIHPVHSVFGNQRHEALRQFFDRLVERF